MNVEVHCAGDDTFQDDYWTKRNVKQPSSNDFPFGNNPAVCTEVMFARENMGTAYKRLYDQFEGEKYFGTYGGIGTPPILVLRDLELIRHVLVKDFPYFLDRKFGGFDFGVGTSSTDTMWKRQLLSLKGDEWKAVRSTFTPIFTSGKMKMMMKFMSSISEELKKELSEAATSGDKIDLKSVCGKFSMETIASCAFGVKAGSFGVGGGAAAADYQSQFVQNAKSIFDFGGLESLVFGAYMLPGLRHLMDLLRVPVFKPRQAQFFIDSITQTIRSRKEAGSRRNDLIDLMIDAMKDDVKNEDNEEESQYDKDSKLNYGGAKGKKQELDEELIVATAVIMLVAGYDTTAVTFSTCLWQLARNPEVQSRLQEEIDEAFQDGEGLDYGVVQGLEYLDMVIHETLRINPPVGANFRECTQDYRLPGTDLVITKGSEVHVPVMGIHLDEKIYPNPTKFDPERFSKEARAARHPMAFVAFSQGPRNCIGMRFALLEIKVGLIKILRQFNVKTCSETPNEFVLDPNSITSNSKHPLWVKVEERQQ